SGPTASSPSCRRRHGGWCRWMPRWTCSTSWRGCSRSRTWTMPSRTTRPSPSSAAASRSCCGRSSSSRTCWRRPSLAPVAPVGALAGQQGRSRREDRKEQQETDRKHGQNDEGAKEAEHRRAVGHPRLGSLEVGHFPAQSGAVQVVSAETGTSQPADIAVHDLVLNFLGTDRVVVLLALDRVLERGVGVIDELAELLGLLTLRRRDAVGMTLHHQLAIGLRDVSRG